MALQGSEQVHSTGNGQTTRRLAPADSDLHVHVIFPQNTDLLRDNYVGALAAVCCTVWYGIY